MYAVVFLEKVINIEKARKKVHIQKSIHNNKVFLLT